MRAAILGLLAAASCIAQAPPPVPPPSDCAADGIVVNSITGQPLRRANVVPGTANGTGTSTDAEGKWTISGITCGAVVFRAEKDGFVVLGAGGSVGIRKPVMLTSGSTVHDVKIELVPESIITGRVVDDEGEPARGALVRGVRSVVRNGRRTTQAFGNANTDSTGSYRLGLAPGKYFVCVNSSKVTYPIGGGKPVIFSESCFPGPITEGAAGALDVKGGQELHADFTLSKLTGVHVRGTVSGLPSPLNEAAAQRVFVQMLKLDASGSLAGPSPLRPEDARNGRFDFANVPPGTYALNANNPVAGEQQLATATVNVGSTDVDGVTLVFQAGVLVTGTVRIEDSGLPAAGSVNVPSKPVVNVNINPVGMGGRSGRVQWDADHKQFSIADVQPGKYRVNINVPGTTYFIKSVRLRDREIRNEDFQVDGPTGPIEIVVSNESGMLQGTVNDSDGKPVASQIIVQCGDMPIYQSRSRDEGTFTIRVLPVGTCKAWAFGGDEEVEYADEEWMRRNAGSGTDVTISGGATAQVTLTRRISAQ